MALVVNILFPLKDSAPRQVELEPSTTIQDLSEFFEQEYNCPAKIKVFFTLDADMTAEPFKNESSMSSVGIASGSKLYGWLKELRENEVVPAQVETKFEVSEDDDDDVMVQLVPENGKSYKLKMPPTSSIAEIKAFCRDIAGVAIVVGKVVGIYMADSKDKDPLADKTRLNELAIVGEIILRVKIITVGGFC